MVGQYFVLKLNENFLLGLAQFAPVGERIEQVGRTLIVGRGLDAMHKLTAQAIQ
ncbi:hypothetical protein D3C84_1213960 [compost metagenome]